MLIGLSGFRGAGKSSVGDILSEQYGFTQLSFAEPVYQSVWEFNPWICVDYHQGDFRRLQDIVNMIGWDKAKRTYPEIRKTLEIMGAEIGRNIININVWVNILIAKQTDLPPEVTDIVITDVRFPSRPTPGRTMFHKEPPLS